MLRNEFHSAGANGHREPMHVLITNYGIATTMNRLGKCLFFQKNYDLASSALLEALSLLQAECNTAHEMVKRNPGIDVAKHQDDVAGTLYALAEVKEAAKKYAEAIKIFQESLQLRRASDGIRRPGKKLNHVHCAMCLAGIGSVHLQRNETNDAFKSFNEAIQYIKKEGLPDCHPIAKMLWEKSHFAAKKMLQEQNHTVGADTTGGEKILTTTSLECHKAALANPWSFTVTRLEEKAVNEKKKGDVQGSIGTMSLVVKMKRDCLTKRRESQQSTKKIKQQLADSLFFLGILESDKNHVKKGMMCFKEAIALYKSSGLNHEDDRVQEIEKRLRMIRRRWRNIPRSGETKAEF
jgi:tetratricopeptide (TPR) repeat protein